MALGNKRYWPLCTHPRHEHFEMSLLVDWLPGCYTSATCWEYCYQDQTQLTRTNGKKYILLLEWSMSQKIGVYYCLAVISIAYRGLLSPRRPRAPLTSYPILLVSHLLPYFVVIIFHFSFRIIGINGYRKTWLNPLRASSPSSTVPFTAQIVQWPSRQEEVLFKMCSCCQHGIKGD